MYEFISIENISFIQEMVILKQQNAKSVSDASIWLTFIYKNSNTPEIEHGQLNSPIIISGQLTSLTNPVHKIPGHVVNKLQILFCDRALLKWLPHIILVTSRNISMYI